MRLNTSEPPWMLGASLVENTFEALEAASGDAPYILEQDDLEAAVWVIADVPIVAIKIPTCRESGDERSKRLQSIRNVPMNELFRPILTGSIDGSVGLLDGGHRIEIAIERGLTHISALVKLDFVPAIRRQLEQCNTPPEGGGSTDFNPHLYEEGGVWFYEDGCVYAAVDVCELPNGRGLTISEWSSHDPGKGYAKRALQWLRKQFTSITANGVGMIDTEGPDISVFFWDHMMRLGLIDQMLDDEGARLEVGCVDAWIGSEHQALAASDHTEQPLPTGLLPPPLPGVIGAALTVVQAPVEPELPQDQALQSDVPQTPN